MTDAITLVTRRTIRASAARLFDAWTEPAQLVAWWGPRPVTCSGAEVDLRVGGRYRITNALPDGTTIVIHGVFAVVERPHKLVYTWCIAHPNEDESSRVTVRFEPRGDACEVIVIHEQIPSAAKRDSHEEGWSGCLDGLERYVDASTNDGSVGP